MSKRQRTPTKPPTPNAPPAMPVVANLDELLFAVEDRCNHVAGVVNAASRFVAGAKLGLADLYVSSILTGALEGVADELEGLADRALKARTGGQS